MTGRSGRNIKKLAGAEFVDRAIFHGRRRAAGEYKSDVLDVAARRTHSGADVNRPLPSGLVRGATCLRCEQFRIFPFRTFLSRPALRNASGLSQASMSLRHAMHHANSNWNPGNFSATRSLNTFHSQIESGDAKCVRSPGSLAKPRLAHPDKHLLRGRKALDRRRQIGIRASHSREHRPD